MKKLLFTILVGCSLLFIACNKDKDDNPVIPDTEKPGDDIKPGDTNTIDKITLTSCTWVAYGSIMSITCDNDKANAILKPILEEINRALENSLPVFTMKFNTDGSYESYSVGDGTTKGTYTTQGNQIEINENGYILTYTYDIKDDILFLIQDATNDPEIRADIEEMFMDYLPEDTIITEIILTVKLKAKK